MTTDADHAADNNGRFIDRAVELTELLVDALARIAELEVQYVKPFNTFTQVVAERDEALAENERLRAVTDRTHNDALAGWAAAEMERDEARRIADQLHVDLIEVYAQSGFQRSVGGGFDAYEAKSW